MQTSLIVDDETASAKWVGKFLTSFPPVLDAMTLTKSITRQVSVARVMGRNQTGIQLDQLFPRESGGSKNSLLPLILPTE